MNTKYKFKTFITTSLPLPDTLPKRLLPTRATFDFFSGLRPEMTYLCVYVNRYGDPTERRTQTRAPVVFNKYITSLAGSRYAEVTLNGSKAWVSLSQIYFTHEEEARKAKEAA